MYKFSHTIEPRDGSNDALLIEVLDRLLDTYLTRVPDAGRVVSLLQGLDNDILNDHIAFRSIHIESILTIFLSLGYEVCMDLETNKPFNFPQKKLTAVWLKHSNVGVPRVFVSQFRFEEGSPQLQGIVSEILKDWKDPIAALDLTDADAIHRYLHTGQWPSPTYAQYQALQKESEYVSWVLYNKYYLNHFTVSVHALNSFDFESDILSLLKAYHESYQKQQSEAVIQDAIANCKRHYEAHMKQFNQWLEDEGFILNGDPESQVNISDDACLLQSSTKSAAIEACFSEGTFQIPGSYVEFAYRGIDEAGISRYLKAPGPKDSLKGLPRRDGFETGNADKIFESTYVGVEAETALMGSSYYEASCKKIADFLG